jgi:hypothetical protein
MFGRTPSETAGYGCGEQGTVHTLVHQSSSHLEDLKGVRAVQCISHTILGSFVYDRLHGMRRADSCR